MIFKIHSVINGKTIYACIDDDGLCRLTCTEDYPEFKSWVEAGGQPLPADSE
jgi:hypothetical protein